MDENTKSIKTRTLPFFFKVAAILILVTGIIGSLFYLFAIGFQLTNKNFFNYSEYKDYTGLSYYFLLLMQLLLNIGLILSGILLLRMKKTGIFVFAITYLILALMSFFLHDDFGWTFPTIGLIILFILILSKGKLS